jgi:hypothetical protein
VVAHDVAALVLTASNIRVGREVAGPAVHAARKVAFWCPKEEAVRGFRSDATKGPSERRALDSSAFASASVRGMGRPWKIEGEESKRC